VLALTGDKTKALADAEASEMLYTRVAALDGATLDDRTAVGVAAIKLGDLLGNPNFENLGRPGSADNAYAKALETFRELARSAPDDVQIRRYLGVVLERIGTMREGAREWADAAKAYQESFEIRRDLAARQPTHRDIQRDLGVAHEKLGDVQRAQSGPSAAVPEYRQALSVYEGLANADPTDANAGRTVAVGRENLGDALRPSGGVTEALDLYRKALAAHRSFLAQDGRNVRARCDAARVAETLGDTLYAAEAPGACAAWRESLQDRQGASDGAVCAAPNELSRVTLKIGGSC
jgi:tetratricopeptide (TPR) repeat protein